MMLVGICNICGDRLTQEWSEANDIATIHPECDTRPDRRGPHPAEGELRAQAFHTALLLAAAQPTPDGSPQWVEFDRAVDALNQMQQQGKHPALSGIAAAYASELGWPVFPLQAGGKAPATPHGFKDATLDPRQIAAWWSENPSYNIGVPTGVAFDVVDVDTPICDTSWWQLQQEADFTGHGLACTSSGGFHIYVPPGVVPAKNRASAFGRGIDFRTKGGYVVAPYSRLASGASWDWWSMPSPDIRRKGVKSCD